MHLIRSIRMLLLALGLLAISVAANAQVGIALTVSFAPPELPVYEQPLCPGDDYIWTPGYWAYGDDDYYWVPGTWVVAPEAGFYWTPAYWGWNGSAFEFYDGYWGPEVGFYGGINYGFGYFGHGFEGGRWDHDHFSYNRAVSNVDVTIVHNVYNTTVVNNNSSSRVSFNGGNGGTRERPTSQEEAAAHQRHVAPVAAQTQHVQAARSNPELRASANHGRPPVAATQKPGAFSARGNAAVEAAGAVHNSPSRAENNAARPSNYVHPNDMPPAERRAAPSTGNAKQDQKYQQQQEKLRTQQDQERQKLQQKQEQDHQRLAQQRADDTRKQLVEQKHQQQTQQLMQKHDQQQQRLQERQQPTPRPEQSRPRNERP
jgi:hypothetical protein